LSLKLTDRLKDLRSLCERKKWQIRPKAEKIVEMIYISSKMIKPTQTFDENLHSLPQKP